MIRLSQKKIDMGCYLCDECGNEIFRAFKIGLSSFQFSGRDTVGTSNKKWEKNCSDITFGHYSQKAWLIQDINDE